MYKKVCKAASNKENVKCSASTTPLKNARFNKASSKISNRWLAVLLGIAKIYGDKAVPCLFLLVSRDQNKILKAFIE